MIWELRNEEKGKERNVILQRNNEKQKSNRVLWESKGGTLIEKSRRFGIRRVLRCAVPVQPGCANVKVEFTFFWFL